nr:hypothetical protein CFP56_54436 [Quercus suber]
MMGDNDLLAGGRDSSAVWRMWNSQRRRRRVAGQLRAAVAKTDQIEEEGERRVIIRQTEQRASDDGPGRDSEWLVASGD